MNIELHKSSELDTVMVPDGYDLKSVPECTIDNLTAIIEKQNQMIIALNALMARYDMFPADEEDYGI